MAAPTSIVVDPYSALSHKEIVGQPTEAVAGAVQVHRSWCPESERRRLAAYVVRDAYRSNVARLVLPRATDDDTRDARREYGDPDLIVDRYRAGVLGDGWTLVVDGADDDLDDEPLLPERPEQPEGDDEIARRVYASREARWVEQATAIVEQWEADWAAQPALQERQEEIRAWAERIGLGPVLVEHEGDALGLGDSVLILWPQGDDWPRVQVMDPSGHFPVLTEHDDGTYPAKVHFAWEYDVTVGGTTTTYVRRITFELVEIASLRSDGPTWIGPDGQPAAAPVITEGEGLDAATGRIWRRMPWADPDDPTDVAYLTCLVSDGSWPTDAIVDGDIDALAPERATWRALADGTVLYRHDLRVDFLPVIHTPGLGSAKEHFGGSVLDSIAQGLDDLSTVDSLTMSAAQYLGHPTVYSAGADGGSGITTPGVVISGPEGGRMDVLDLSSGVEKLQALDEAILDRVLTNARLPKAMVGRADYAQASGVRIAMEFAPFDQVVAVIRMARAQKWRLLLRFAQRMAQVAGVLEPGPTPEARLVPGSYRPSNTAEIVEQVSTALQAHAISTHTAVALLVAAGLPIDDANVEVDRIAAEDTESAKALADATGSEALAAERLGLELPDTGPAPTPVITLPTPGGPPADDEG